MRVGEARHVQQFSNAIGEPAARMASLPLVIRIVGPCACLLGRGPPARDVGQRHAQTKGKVLIKARIRAAGLGRMSTKLCWCVSP